MKKTLLLATALCVLLGGGVIQAQEHWNEGPVWEISYYRTAPGKFSDYMKWLRTHYLPLTEKAKQSGLILDYKVFLQPPAGADDWNVGFAVLHASAAKAMDYDAEADAKWESIQAEHFKTGDQEEQRNMAASRFEMRRFIGTKHVREIKLKPMP